jgi:hypothetical protein
MIVVTTAPEIHSGEYRERRAMPPTAIPMMSTRNEPAEDTFPVKPAHLVSDVIMLPNVRATPSS